jgi:hypothetical protein
MHNAVNTVAKRQSENRLMVSKIEFQKCETNLAIKAFQPRVLQALIVIIIQIVDAKYLMPGIKQGKRGPMTDKSGNASDKVSQINRLSSAGIAPPVAERKS